MRVRWRIVFGVFALQALLGLNDAWMAIECHEGMASECWSWFGIFAVNIPASVLAAMLLGFTVDFLDFYPQWVLSFLVYVAVGTLWWLVVLHAANWTSSWLSKRAEKENA